MGHKVVIVDDSGVTRKIIRKALHMIGLDIEALHECGNGEEALELIRQEPLDLLITDLNMPQMTGVELLKELHETRRAEGMKIIVITSDRNEERLEELQDLEVCAVLNKPFRPESLREAIVQKCHVE